VSIFPLLFGFVYKKKNWFRKKSVYELPGTELHSGSLDYR
jgi:hypothetical protein